MKINDYKSDLTRREGGKEQVNVAQVGELLSKINADFWGALYLLIWLRGWKAWVLIITLILFALGLTGCATPCADRCGNNCRPVAVITVR